MPEETGYPDEDMNQEFEAERGLGSLEQQGRGEPPFASEPNSSLKMLNKKREGDNVVTERDNERTLDGIRQEERAKIAQEMTQQYQRDSAMQQAQSDGYEAGMMDGLGSLNREPAGYTREDFDRDDNVTSDPYLRERGIDDGGYYEPERGEPIVPSDVNPYADAEGLGSFNG